MLDPTAPEKTTKKILTRENQFFFSEAINHTLVILKEMLSILWQVLTGEICVTKS